MMLDVQKRLAADILKCSPKRVKFTDERLNDIKESITKADLRGLINDGAIYKIPTRGISRYWAKERRFQQKKGRQKGFGARKGKKTARTVPKDTWMNKIRAQRGFLMELKEKGMLDTPVWRDLYMKSKGGFFRSVRHIKLYATEHGMIKKATQKITK